MGRLYYGWWVLAGLVIAYTASNGIVINALPLSYPDMIKEFGWNQEEVTRPASFFYLFAALLAPVGGYLVDRFPPQRVMLFGVALITVALFSYQFISELWQMTAIFVVFALGLSCGGIIASMLLLTRWFVKYRGLAVGVLLMASSFGGALFSLAYIPGDWRTSVLLMAVIGGVMMIVAILFLVRNKPQDMGLHPDGAAEEPVIHRSVQSDSSVTTGPTLGEAVKTPVFWLLAFSTGTMWFCIVGVLNHQAIYLTDDAGIDAAHLPFIFSAFFWAAVLGKVSFGYLSDLFDKGLIMLLGVINLALGLMVLRLVGPGDVVTAYIYAVVYGFGYSGAFTMIQLMIAEFFSGTSYGKILGCFTMVDTSAGAFGIFTLGYMRVALGSYIPSFSLMIALCVIATGCVILMNQIVKRDMKLATAPS